MQTYLRETTMLDFKDSSIKQLIDEKKWAHMTEFDKLKSIYNFVRDEILFGYNSDDTISASRVLKDGYGQCNAKGTLLMALFRANGLPCRIHGFTIDKKLQKGAMTGLIYQWAPKNVIHSWVEVYFEGSWYYLEGFIIDKPYLNKLQLKFPNQRGEFLGYGVATDNFRQPKIDWNKNNTYIQKEGINQDFGVFDAPDLFFNTHRQDLSTVKKIIYQQVGRKWMNHNVKKIRNS